MVTARITFTDGRTVECTAINPGSNFGRTFVLAFQESYWAEYVVVESDHLSDAIDILSEDDKYGDRLLIESQYLSDYNPDDLYYNSSGLSIDTDNLYFQDTENIESIVYLDENVLPSSGIAPRDYYYFSSHLDSLNDKLSELSENTDIMPELRAMCADCLSAHIDEKEQMCHLILDYLSDNPIIYTFDYDRNDQEIFELCERIEDLFTELKPICEGLKR